MPEPQVNENEIYAESLSSMSVQDLVKMALENEWSWAKLKKNLDTKKVMELERIANSLQVIKMKIKVQP